MPGYAVVVCLLGAVALLCGCGGEVASISPLPEPSPPGDGAATHEVGPLVIHTASAAGFVAEEIPTDSAVSLVALHGSTIQYLASQAMLDRIVFVSGRDDPGDDIWVCNLDGSNLVQLTKNVASAWDPCWSPDGTKIVFARQWPYQDTDILIMDADGSGTRALTANNDMDSCPSFSPDGRRIAFDSDSSGNSEIWLMFADGSGVWNLTQDPAWDAEPDWSPLAYAPSIFFVSDRGATDDIYSIDPDLPGAPVLRVSTGANERAPSHHPFQERLAFYALVGTTDDVFVTGPGYTAPRNLSATPEDQEDVAWSTDGRHVCYESWITGSPNMVLQEVEAPYTKWALTHGSAYNWMPDLGSPTMQTDRVLIGPAGSDWGGANPIWSSAYAAIAAFSTDGYENLVRIGISPAHVGSLQISPLSQTAAGGERPAGVVLEATKIVNLREDAGRGLDATVWDLDPLGVTAAILYFDPETGKLVTVLALDDAAYPSDAGAPAAVAEQADGPGLVVTGRFAAVFDASGNRIAGAASSVTVGADGAVSAN